MMDDDPIRVGMANDPIPMIFEKEIYPMTLNAAKLNTGHGHVWARPDGVKARCGGPALCKECARDLVTHLYPGVCRTGDESHRVASWMMSKGYATGHGDTVEDMLAEFEWQALERGAKEATDQGRCSGSSRVCRSDDIGMTDTPHRTRGWNKREVPRVHVTVRFEPSELAEIDAARSDMTRQEWIYGITLAHARRVNSLNTGE